MSSQYCESTLLIDAENHQWKQPFLVTRQSTMHRDTSRIALQAIRGARWAHAI